MELLKSRGSVVTFLRLRDLDRDRCRIFIFAVVRLSVDLFISGALCALPTERSSASSLRSIILPATELEPPIEGVLFLSRNELKEAGGSFWRPRFIGGVGAAGALSLILRTYVPHCDVGNAFVEPRALTLNFIVGLSPWDLLLTIAYVHEPSDRRTNAPSLGLISPTAAAVAFLPSMIISSSLPLSPMLYLDNLSGVYFSFTPGILHSSVSRTPLYHMPDETWPRSYTISPWP
mmetsp:Transcript_28533/g.64364  ORF Transcript_28533/g.64364 Transcript_28533/m.64364 type:complete len:233 (-) Transcript_28533:3115-3813(-)